MTNPLSHTDVRLRLIIIIGLIMLSGVGIASAYDTTPTYSKVLTDSKVIHKEYTHGSAGSSGDENLGTFLLGFGNIEAWSDCKVVYVRNPLGGLNGFSNWTLAESHDGKPEYVDFIVRGTNDNIGNGYLAYNILYDSDNVPVYVQFWVEINEWDITGLSGYQRIMMQLKPDSSLRQLSFKYSYSSDEYTEDKPIGIGTASWSRMTGYYIVSSEFFWENTITINDTHLSLIRDGDYSKLKVQTEIDTYYEESYDDRNMFIIPPITWTVTNPIGTNFSGSYEGESSPGPADPGPFSLALSPASVQVGETVTATLTVQDDAPHYSYLVWSCTPDDHPDMATWSYRIQDVNGTWYERAANGDEIPISAADALTYQATPAYPGGHHIGVTIYDHHPPCQGLEQRATLAKPFEALYKSGSSPVRIQVVDERTGAHIAGSHIQVIDSQLPPFEGTGINPIIDTTLPQGSEMFYLQRNAYDEPRYRIFADADGYRQVTENQWFSVNPPAPNTVTTVTVQMAATVAPPEDPNNAFVTFRIRDEDGNPVREARVTLDRWTRHALGTRPVTFEVPRGATYQYTVEPIDPGLYPATGSVTVGAEDSYEVNVVLSRTPGDDPGATPPPRDTRTNEEKGKAVIDLLADNAELIATLAILAAVMGLINLIMPGRRRR